jgi:hypothetical protein
MAGPAFEAGFAHQFTLVVQQLHLRTVFGVLCCMETVQTISACKGGKRDLHHGLWLLTEHSLQLLSLLQCHSSATAAGRTAIM